MTHPRVNHTLVTFLGRAQLQPGTGYRTARYRFPDGTEEVTAFFGLALARRLRPDRVLVLGTSGSMWPALIEHGAEEGAKEPRLALIEAADSGKVTQTLLNEIQPFARRTMGANVELKIIPYAAEPSDQLEILRLIASEVPSGRVSFDVTHAFRHLSMLSLLSAFVLRESGRLEVVGLWYGALDMTQNGVTPVVSLDGLLTIERWLTAFARFEGNGDFSSFADLLERDGVPRNLAQSLSRAWHFLNLSDVTRAANELRPLLDHLSTPLSGPAELFRERLRRALRWAREDDLAEQFRQLAFQALARLDFLRASLYGLEAFLAREAIAVGMNPSTYESRESAKESFKQALKDGKHPYWKRHAYWLLTNIRNACAHGTKPTSDRYEQLIANPERLAAELRTTLNRLTNS